MEPFFFGLLTDRVVLWDNRKGSRFASCDRRDWQCLFLPLSPCVLTRAAMDNATRLSKADVKALRREGALPARLAGDRVIALASDNHQVEPKGTRAALVKIIEALYAGDRDRGAAAARPWHPDAAARRRVREYLLDGTSTKRRRWFIWHAPLLYVLRPNVRLREALDAALRRNLPADFDGARAIGLPIRGTRAGGDRERRTATGAATGILFVPFFAHAHARALLRSR